MAATDSLATRLRRERTARTDVVPGRAATRDLIRVAVAVPVAATVLLAVLVTATKLLAGGTIGGLAAQVGAAWLVINQVPLTVGGVTVGALPLAPTLALIAAVAVVTGRAARHVESLHEVGSIAGAALAGPLLWTALALAVVADGAAVSSIGQASPLPAFGHTLLVQGIGVGIGVARRCVQPLVDAYEFPVTDRVGARAGGLAFLGLIAGGALLVSVGFFANWGRVGDLLAQGDSFDGYLGLTALSVLYLPNVVVAGAALAVGASVHAGTATVDALGVVPGQAPPLPILGVLPTDGLGTAGLAIFVIPVAVGALVSWYCRSIDPLRHLRAIAVAAATCAALTALACVMAGGRAGELGQFGSGPALAGVYTFAWIAVIGALGAGIYYLLPASRGERAAAAGFDLDALLDDEDFADLEIVDDSGWDQADDSDWDPSFDEETTEVLDVVAPDGSGATPGN